MRLSLCNFSLLISRVLPQLAFQFLSHLPLASVQFHSVQRNQGGECIMAKAEACFAQLFEQLPICSASDFSGELAFRCQHFNVLDICFLENDIRCPPAAIGATAKIAYQKVVDKCLFEQKEHQANSQKGHGHHRLRGNAHHGFLAPPSELQFISLFGYLQIQCRPRRRTNDNRRSSQFRLETTEPVHPNCSARYMHEIVGQCESDMKKKPGSPFSDLDRHKYLWQKLDISSKLLRFPETKVEEECLMVRSVLSDIFQLHQRHCFHTTVTRCLCEQLAFERMCAIQCSNLEAFGLPLNRKLLWTDFKGRLSSAQSMRMPWQTIVPIGFLLFVLIPLWLLPQR